MKKKLLIALLAIASAFCLALCFSACSNGNGGNIGGTNTEQGENKPNKDPDNEENKKPEEHTHSYTESVVDPNCTEKGYTLHTCVCGDSYKDTETDALGHNFVNYTPDNNATCLKDETKTAKCERCEVTDTLTIENTKVGHNYVNNKCTYCEKDKVINGLEYELNNDKRSYTVIGIGNETATDVVIAATYDGFPLGYHLKCNTNKKKGQCRKTLV